MNTLIVNPRGHRAEWAKAHPQALIENGGLLSAGDLSRWACDLCMSPLDPDQPIFCLGGPEGKSLCVACIKAMKPEDRRVDEICQCEGCGKLTRADKLLLLKWAGR